MNEPESPDADHTQELHRLKASFEEMFKGKVEELVAMGEQAISQRMKERILESMDKRSAEIMRELDKGLG
ncbi:MAG: hypothetical protein HQL66_08040 [Magnetococcales bacterium]|nr:hypothetical protein [Magnetococcales bacterium]